MTSHPNWRAPTPDVVESPSEHSASDFARELAVAKSTASQHVATTGPEPSDIKPSRKRTVSRGDGGSKRAATRNSQEAIELQASLQNSSRSPSDTDRRVRRLSRGTEEIGELLSKSEDRVKDLENDIRRSETRAIAAEERADAAEAKCSHLASLLERERARHATGNLRVVDLEAEVERLTRRINEAIADAETREAELRLAQQRLAETKGTYERVDAERAAGQSNERKRAALLTDRIAIQDEEIHRLESLLTAAQKSREEAIRKAKLADDEAARAKRDLHAAQREFDTLEARLRSGALVEATQLYATQSELHASTMRASIAETNCERLLQLLADTTEYGRLVQEDVLGTGYVYLPDQGDLIVDSTTGVVALPRKYIPTTVTTTIREIVGSVNDARRARAPGSRSSSIAANARHPPQALAAATPLISVEREHAYWIPKGAFDAAEAFRAKHLPSSLPLSCFHRFFVELNVVWRERLEAKLRALGHVLDRQCAIDGLHTRGKAGRAPGSSSSQRSATKSPTRAANVPEVHNVTAAALVDEASTIERRLSELRSVVERADRRAAVPRGLGQIIDELFDGFERSAKVYRRAAIEIGRLQRVIHRETDLFAPSVSAAAAALNTSGVDFVQRPSALQYLENAITALHRNAEVLRAVAGGPAKTFVTQLRATVSDGRTGRTVSASKCLDLLERAADEMAGLLMAVSDEASRVQRRADRLAAAPLDAFAAAHRETRTASADLADE